LTPIQRLTTAGLLLAFAATASACASRREQQMSAQIPDDFRVVQRAPLAIPPEYALRPPSPGEPRPQELDPESAVRSALTPGPRVDPAASPGERALVSKVTKGVDPDPLIKSLVDDEQGDLAHKSKGFADLVMFWKPGDPPTGRVSNEATALNAADEAARIAQLTGNQPVTIQQQAAPAPKQRRIFKLPGL
jgi:hypothetical protein